MKNLVLFSFLMIALPSFASGVGLRPTVKTSFGEVVYMTSEDAASYCQQFGTRLPTAREAAEFFNPDGVSDYSRPGFLPVAIDANYAAFYYNYKTYRVPNDAEGFYIWTSSTENSWGSISPPYEFELSLGRLIRNASEGGVAAVRCVR